MFSSPPITKNIELKENNFRTLEWSTVTETEVKQAILTSASNKTSDPDDLSFMIIQRAFKTIFKIFYKIYSALIEHEYHPQCWREDTEIILKKIEKSDYSKSKIYRMITLLNCLSKVSEKIIATRLSYLAEITDLLNSDQLEERRQKSAINAALSLTYDIQEANNKDNTLFCLLLDVKEVFDHVSLNQLLQIMQQLNLPLSVKKWMQHFLTQRSISLAFDDERQSAILVSTEISQDSSISSILFLIYIRFLFKKIQTTDIQVKSFSYIDDVALIVEDKTAEKNSQILERISQFIFQWAAENAVKFDDSKSELIHFHKQVNYS